uniref:Calcineurin B-like protein 10 isoform X1 n=1 Tax=Rhizophora mucronata TaxID=61149 RepID=A0A2P2KLZ0_RHIMU
MPHRSALRGSKSSISSSPQPHKSPKTTMHPKLNNPESNYNQTKPRKMNSNIYLHIQE